ncbi:MAG TPA: asparagine synthase (glutamine-hydrolyzing) [Steroidobacteraceae bacterium]|nr:asparagine synthase (glutamine-hydrolyzing) [Steroidobacteraceae bacterium]
MCGIVGFQGDFSAALLKRMTDSVAHRGPDGEGELRIEVPEGSATGLGHRRLAIIDLSAAGCQPMVLRIDAEGRAAVSSPGATQASAAGGIALVFNGEIYNYRELRAELSAEGHRFTTQTDSEVLLHLYRRDGLAMISRLNGIFAFAIHDGRERGRPAGVDRGALFLVRDPFGVKPLYYASVPQGLLFASEIKAILCEPSVPRDIDETAVHEMLAYLWTPAPRTVLGAVRKLEPGCALLVHAGTVVRHWRHYRLPYDGQRDRRPAGAIAAELLDRLQEAVRRQLVADVPVGAFLSGGLDSSSVVAMMRKLQPERAIRCFAIGFADGGDGEGNPDDLPYARRVAQHLNVDLQEIRIDASAIDRLEEMVVMLDEPQADPAPINALLIAERARAEGIPVLLSGAGGDDIFSGYRRHRALRFERWWSWLPQGMRDRLQARAVHAALGGGRLQGSVQGRRLTKLFAHAAASGDERLIGYFRWSPEELRRSLYTPDLAQRLAAVDAARPLRDSLAEIPCERDPLQRMLFLETRHFLADHNLNYTDRAGMSAGVEIRVPLLDPDLVEFAAGIPPGLKQNGGEGKAIFKQAMIGTLPRDVIYRPKSGFGVPLRRWLRHELRSRVDDLLAPDALRRRGLFAPERVRRLIEADRQGRVDGSYTIFALMCFELWCRRFIDA